MGSAQLDRGVRRLWKALRHEAPAVAQTAARLGLAAGGKDTVAQVIKTYHALHSGKLSLVRVWSGQVSDGMSLNGGRVAGVLRPTGAPQEELPVAVGGGVVAPARM